MKATFGSQSCIKGVFFHPNVVRRCWESYNIQQMHILQKRTFVEHWKLFTLRLNFIISFFFLKLLSSCGILCCLASFSLLQTVFGTSLVKQRDPGWLDATCWHHFPQATKSKSGLKSHPSYIFKSMENKRNVLKQQFVQKSNNSHLYEYEVVYYLCTTSKTPL